MQLVDIRQSQIHGLPIGSQGEAMAKGDFALQKNLGLRQSPLQTRAMEKLTIHKIDSDIVWELIFKGWELVRVNYGLTLVLIGIMFLSFFLGLVPIVGIIGASVIGAFIPLAFYHCCAKWEKGEKGSFADATSVLQNSELISKMLPLMVINIVVSAGPNIMGQLGLGIGLLSVSTFPITVLVGAAYPILFFNYKKMDFIGAFTTALEGIGKNIIPFIIGFVLLGVFSIIAIVCLVLPFVFVALPTIFGYNYLWYRAVYEGLKITVKDEGII